MLGACRVPGHGLIFAVHAVQKAPRSVGLINIAPPKMTMGNVSHFQLWDISHLFSVVVLIIPWYHGPFEQPPFPFRGEPLRS